jgi:AraC-like DNA-binding protein
MAQNLTLIKHLSLDNRTAEFPGLVQALSKHTQLIEMLALSILKYVQKQQLTPAERQTQYTQRLTARLTAQGQDISIVADIVAIAEDLNLFDN